MKKTILTFLGLISTAYLISTAHAQEISPKLILYILIALLIISAILKIIPREKIIFYFFENSILNS
ncbi:MAG: hypothetical protein LBI43_06430 [Streptococcaceae bacterium]|jgi:hypothetical protein|nr:hypothetical protein [Streptococcaceae bacterium]